MKNFGPQPEKSGEKSEKPDKAERDTDTAGEVPKSVREGKEKEEKYEKLENLYYQHEGDLSHVIDEHPELVSVLTEFLNRQKEEAAKETRFNMEDSFAHGVRGMLAGAQDTMLHFGELKALGGELSDEDLVVTQKKLYQSWHQYLNVVFNPEPTPTDWYGELLLQEDFDSLLEEGLHLSLLHDWKKYGRKFWAKNPDFLDQCKAERNFKAVKKINNFEFDTEREQVNSLAEALFLIASKAHYFSEKGLEMYDGKITKALPLLLEVNENGVRFMQSSVCDSYKEDSPVNQHVWRRIEERLQRSDCDLIRNKLNTAELDLEQADFLSSELIEDSETNILEMYVEIPFLQAA